MITRVFLFLYVCSAAFAFAQQGVYEGTVAGVAVSAKFDDDGASYYYHKIGKTIELKEFPDKPGFFLESEPSHMKFPEDFDPQYDSWWEISAKGDNISGGWKSGTKPGKPLPIVLHKVPDSSFEAHRLDRPYVEQKMEEANGIRVKILAHPVTGVTLPQVVSGIPADVLKQINEVLSKDASELNTSFTDCSDWEGGILPTVLNSKWISFDWNSSGFCGGVHPNEDSVPLSFDTTTGERINFSEWIAADYWKSDAIQGELQIDVAKSFEVDECLQQVKELEWQQFTPWMSKDTFDFRLDETDRAYIACEGDYAVSFDQMRKYIDPAYLERYDQFVAVAEKSAAL